MDLKSGHSFEIAANYGLKMDSILTIDITLAGLRLGEALPAALPQDDRGQEQFLVELLHEAHRRNGFALLDRKPLVDIIRVGEAVSVGQLVPVLFLYFCRAQLILCFPTLSFFVLDDLDEVVGADPSESCLLVGHMHLLDESHRLEHIDYVVESADLGLDQT